MNTTNTDVSTTLLYRPCNVRPIQEAATRYYAIFPQAIPDAPQIRETPPNSKPGAPQDKTALDNVSDEFIDAMYVSLQTRDSRNGFIEYPAGVKRITPCTKAIAYIKANYNRLLCKTLLKIHKAFRKASLATLKAAAAADKRHRTAKSSTSAHTPTLS